MNYLGNIFLKANSSHIHLAITTLFLLLYGFFPIKAQEKATLLGDWIKVGVTYLDGTEVEESHPLKYTFLKYSFKPKNKAAIITDYTHAGNFNSYEDRNGTIEISTNFNAKITLGIIRLNSDSLIVVQPGTLGATDPSSLLITLIRYEHLQKTSEWNGKDLVGISKTDTVYKASRKIHPTFSNPYGLRHALQTAMPSYSKYMMGFSQDYGRLFLATFVVRKSGSVDNIKILQGMDDKFNKEFIKTCSKMAKNWKPAYYNGEPVDAQVTLEIDFNFMDQFLTDERYTRYAAKRIEEGDIYGAITYFDRMIAKNPKNEKALINRGYCYLLLNDQESACEDFRILRNLGFDSGKSLLEKHCK
ncbi:energy transducer TonB [Sphingobacterium corticibacterium]|uniref:TonB C-terminal domain-containing protein n=1 Tax=Sphingobacterium corticibacterium TaxID=2484746 RepID=A0A4Q6XWR5_9SPHI|nr:energy transducer TonB [Sphingobacterium corticibacterium]RZF61429.1 hypothetical protein EWE74_00875 [Sphingobacterium corticibacterium]